MKHIAKLIFGFLLTFPVLLVTVFPVSAAMIRADDSMYLSEDVKNLEDLYLFGNSVTIDAPVENDLVIAGGDLTVNGDISGSLMAAGGDIVVRSAVANTARIAGGNVAISGKIDRDLLITGGSVRITKDASISGDVLFLGGQLRLEGPVGGNVYVNGGDITINSPVGKNVQGEIGRIVLGRNAVINGDFTYASEEKAEVNSGAVIHGKQTHKPPTRPEREESRGMARAFSAGAIYKLVIDIAAGLLLLFLLPSFIKKAAAQVSTSPVTSTGAGFIFLFITPVLALFLLLLLWLGVAAFFIYFVILILSLYVGKILIGIWLLRWWAKRNKTDYTADWKAVVVGTIVSFILFIIPVLGWVIGFVIYLIALGAVVRTLLTSVSSQRNEKRVTEKADK